MTRSYEHVKRAVFDRPWAILPSKMDAIVTALEMIASGQSTPWEGEKQEPSAVQHFALEEGSNGANPGIVAVLPLYGVLMQRVSPMAEMSGATSTERFKRAFREQMNNPQVKTIILDVDSPGGSVYGTDELAAEIRDAAKRKNVIAVADSLMASAAYYVSSGASEVVASPSSEVGSIGVLAVHYDFSVHAELEGVKPTLIKAGKYKAEGHPDFPLTDDALQHIQEDVDRYYGMFLRAVAAGRGVGVEAVRRGFGEGRVVGAQEAVRLGMADRVATLEETIARFAGGGRPSRRSVAAEAREIFKSNRLLTDEEKAAIRADFQAKYAQHPYLAVELEDLVFELEGDGSGSAALPPIDDDAPDEEHEPPPDDAWARTRTKAKVEQLTRR